MPIPSTSPLSRIPRAVAAFAALDAAPVLVLWVDQEGVIGYANAQAEVLTGWSADKLSGEPIVRLVPQWEGQNWKESVWLTCLQSSSGRLRVDLSLRRKDGSIHVLQAEILRMMVAGQEFASIYLQPSPQTTTSAMDAGLLNALPTPIASIDAALRVRSANKAFFSLLFMDEARVLGIAIRELLAPADGDEDRWPQLASAGLANWRTKIRDANGRLRHVIISAVAEEQADSGTHFTIIAQDVTEHFELVRLTANATSLATSDLGLEQVARNIPGMIYRFILTPEGKASFPYASAGSQDIWEVDPAEIRDDAGPLLQHMHPDDMPAFQASVMRSATDLSAWEFEGRLITRSGKLKWWHAASRPELAENGNIVWQGLLMDVTQQKGIEEELKVAKRKAESAARSKSDFLANMSHEIRTPMNGVIGMADLLKNTQLQPRQQHFVETIRSSAEVLLTIINDILDVSKMEAGKLQISHSTFDLRRTLEDVVTLLAPRAYDKGLELILRLDHRAPAQVDGDFVRIRQVLTNLIGNAIKFTGSGHVVVKMDEVNRAGGIVQVRFAISDTGIGISPEAVPRLFQKFEQEDHSTSRRFGGTGLGLSISKQLVELMGGQMLLETELGKGSTFSFTLDLPFSEQEVVESTLTRSLKGMRILAVDDNPVNREVMHDLLGHWGMQHVEVDSGAAALVALRQARAAGAPFDLAILDILMPEMDGISLAAAIRAEPEIRDLPMVIATSADLTDDMRRQLGTVNITAILFKPLRQFELRQTLQQAIHPRDVELPVDTPSVVPTAAPVGISATAGMRVLLAEDNEINVEIATEMLQSLGLVVDHAPDGRKAVEMQRANNYRLIFMDCQMPEMDGFEATTVIRADNRSPRPIIIALTAHAMSEFRDRSLQSGMDDHLTKPITIATLTAAVERHIQTIRDADSAPTAAPAVETGPAASALENMDGHRERLKRSDQPSGSDRASGRPTTSTPRALAGFTRTAVEPTHVPPIPELPGIDVRVGLATTMGKADFYKRMLGKFHDGYVHFATDFVSAQTAPDPRAAERMAHTLKGNAGNMGAMAVMAAASDLEDACREAAGPERISTQFMATVAALAPVLAGLTQFIEARAPALQPNPESTAKDLATIRAGLAQLKALLADSDSEALECADKLARLAQGTAMAEQLDAVTKAVSQCDFDAALAALPES